MVVVPSLKVTAPVGVAPDCPDTVAVKATDWPKAEGLADEVRVVSDVRASNVQVTVTYPGQPLGKLWPP
jgi:hypothetical protein